MSAHNNDPPRSALDEGSDGGLLAQLGPILAGSVLSIDAARRSLARDPAHADELLARTSDNIDAALAHLRSAGVRLR